MDSRSRPRPDLSGGVGAAAVGAGAGNDASEWDKKDAEGTVTVVLLEA